jgi:hypothetical protein
MSRGRRYDENPKLNLKKVAATIIAIIVFIMIIVSLKKILSPENMKKSFVQDVAYFPVYEDGKWGVIKSSGEKLENLMNDEMIIIPDNNVDVFIFTEDINYEEETYKTKVLNSRGAEIFSGYGSVEPFENTNGKKTWYEKNVLRYKSNDKYGLIDFKGKEVLKAEYDNIYPLPGVENCLVLEKEEKKGIFNTAMEEIVVELEYAEVGALSETYQNGYIVKNKDNKVGLVGSDKSKILTCQYDEIKNISGNNYYVVIENGALEIINSYGKIILNKGFDSVEAIDLDNFIVKKDDKYGLIDKDGNVIITIEYDDLKFSITDYFIAKKGDKYGIISKDGTNVIDYGYKTINYVKEADFYIAEKEDYTTDIIDRNFNIQLSGIIVSELDLDLGYLRVRQNDEYHYYNFKFEEKTNKEVLSRNTLFIVKENGKYGYENKDGKRIVDCIYDDAKEQNAYGYCVVNKDGLWGVLKSDGTIILEPTVDLHDYVYIDFIGQWHRFNDTNLYAYTK